MPICSNVRGGTIAQWCESVPPADISRQAGTILGFVHICIWWGKEWLKDLNFRQFLQHTLGVFGSEGDEHPPLIQVNSSASDPPV